MPSNNSPITLPILPNDIHVCILVFLDWQSIKSLRLTCRIFASLLPEGQLIIQRTLCTSWLYDQEMRLARRMEQEYWDAAEQAFLGLNYNAFSSSHDPDLAAYLKRRSCSSESLPCYFCLRWLPSPTADDKFASKSCFSRTRSTLNFDLGAKRARSRNCIECGLRRGMYHAGTIVKQSYVCLGCGKLGEPMGNRHGFRLLDVQHWWRASFCQACFEDPAICNMTADQLQHEKQFGKYDIGLKQGKAYRLEKGRVLRERHGVHVGSEKSGEQNNDKEQKDWPKPVTGRDRKGRPPSADRGPNAGYCHVMDEMRFCYCSGWHPPWFNASQRKQELQLDGFMCMAQQSITPKLRQV